MTLPVLAANKWATNAELIADVARLGYINETDKVLDPTYGQGVWWKKFRPADLTIHDLAIDGVDFRLLPHFANTFDVVAYDPPYVAVGGRGTSTLKAKGGDLHGRYGLTDAPPTPESLQVLIKQGLDEIFRVTKPKGFILAKTQDYISSGKLWIGTHYMLSDAIELGLKPIDRFERISHPRPQPKHARQVHARRNLSTLFVFQKPKASR